MARRNRRAFTNEYKAEVVERIRRSGKSIGEAAQLGLPKRALARMVLNTGFEALIEWIPIVVGDAFDVIFEANLRLIERAIERT